ncbi:long-chain-fatty-acid--CoA ligase [Nocardia carnea]|uniref:long-chain-fatty-acid--CoA ligase n=1 Tax=Nocardia carnea TaxID=37328 RepID=UPI002458D1A2|nr:long-chain-fatty-acid--CoA ligase [Nocardia carnea]
MNRITRSLFDEPVSEVTGLWSGPDASELTFRSWDQLRANARRVAAGLAEAGVVPGDSVAILAGPADDVTVTVEAIWMRGAMFTMLHQPTPRMNLETWLADTRSVIEMLDARVVVVSEPFTDAVRGLDLGAPLAVVHELADRTDSIEHVPVAEDDTAILQLTSGTTGVPKAVAISYRNLQQNHAAMVDRTGFTAEWVGVSWLPLYHDMGMIGMLMTPLLAQATTVIVPPLAFLKSPVSWAELINRFNGNYTAAPNFAYSLLARRLRRAPGGAYDLSCMRVAVNGAEIVDETTLEEFLAATARFGFRPEALMPAYGMAETTLATSFTDAGARYSVDIVDSAQVEGAGVVVRDSGGVSRTLMRLGTPVAGIELKVVDGAGAALPADRIGEILVRGDAVTRRYLLPGGYVSAVDADGWLATGDLGYLTDTGETVVTGRKKDIIIVSGRNIAPTTVERAAAAVEGVRAGSVAAVAVRLPGMAREGIAVIAESDSAEDAERSERIRKDVARAVYDDIGIAPAVVTIVHRGALPKTPSGKLRRSSAAALIPS